ncbi:MAG: PAS domain-containing protein [Raineya sp.]|nr:PAS domain-containing protein [Raineya sp.]
MARKNRIIQFFTSPYFSLRRRITGGLLLIFTLFALAITLFLIRLSQLAEREQYLLNIAYPSQEKLESLKGYITQTNSALQNEMIYRLPSFASERENIWNYFIKATTDSLNRYEKEWKLLEDRTDYATLLTELEKLRRYQKSISRIVEEQEREGGSYSMTGVSVSDTTRLNITQEQQEATFNSQTAFPNTDPEATIEGVEVVRSKERQIFETSSTTKIDADRFVVLSENAKQLYQKQITEITQKIYTDIDRLLKGRKEQIRLEQESLSFHYKLLIITGILFLCLMIVIVYWRGRAINQKIYGRLQEIDEYLHELAEGNLPKINLLQAKDEATPLIRNIEKLTYELAQTQELAKQIGQGNFDTQFQVFENKGVLGKAFLQMQEGLKSVSEQENIRNWLNEGLTLFADILRDTENPQKLYDNLVRNAVKYVRGQYGGIYIISTEKDVVPHLELKSAYALDKKKYIKQQIYLGQGLVGQCWQEGETIYLLKIPKDYIHIASGLGEEAPRSILLVPIKLGSEVYGVLEIASLHLLTETEKNFLEVIAEDIASAISTIQSTEQTKLLLDAANQEMEQISVQKAEMEQNVAQLIAEREALQQRNADMAAFVEAIQKAMIVVELDKHGYFMDVNDNFLEVTGYTRREVIGQHRSFYAPKDSDPAEFSLVWSQLSQGNFVEKNLKRLRKNGSEIWLRASFFPVLDKTGNLVKVTCICTDVTSKILQETRDQETQKTAGFKNTVLEHSFLVFETDSHLHIKDINEYAMNDLKIAKLDYIGHHIDEIILGRWDYKALKVELENRGIAEGLLVLKTADFGFRYVKMIIASVKDKKGEIESIFWVGTDITESKVKENQLEDKVRYLEKKLQTLTEKEKSHQ